MQTYAHLLIVVTKAVHQTKKLYFESSFLQEKNNMFYNVWKVKGHQQKNF